jgi:predicted O-methyltransferase YrrM
MRHRVWVSRPVSAAREALLVGLRPLSRRAIDHARSPNALLRAARLAVPGGSHQIPEEISGFVEYARPREPVRVCEIGTAGGGTTIILSRLAPSVRAMIGIDLEIQNGRVITALAPRGQRIELLETSSLDEATVGRVEGLLEGEPLDVLFIDGSHHYEDVRRDFLSYRRLVRPGGLIAFHDIVPDHGERHSRHTHNWAGGVPTLWREVREAYTSREFVRDQEQDAFGIGVIEYSPEVAFPPEAGR